MIVYKNLRRLAIILFLLSSPFFYFGSYDSVILYTGIVLMGLGFVFLGVSSIKKRHELNERQKQTPIGFNHSETMTIMNSHNRAKSIYFKNLKNACYLLGVRDHLSFYEGHDFQLVEFIIKCDIKIQQMSKSDVGRKQVYDFINLRNEIVAFHRNYKSDKKETFDKIRSKFTDLALIGYTNDREFNEPLILKESKEQDLGYVSFINKNNNFDVDKFNEFIADKLEILDGKISVENDGTIKSSIQSRKQKISGISLEINQLINKFNGINQNRKQISSSDDNINKSP